MNLQHLMTEGVALPVQSQQRDLFASEEQGIVGQTDGLGCMTEGDVAGSVGCQPAIVLLAHLPPWEIGRD